MRIQPSRPHIRRAIFAFCFSMSFSIHVPLPLRGGVLHYPHMKTTRQGFATVLLLALVAFLLLGGGAYLYTQTKPANQSATENPTLPQATSTMQISNSQISFDACGKLNEYEKENWYNEFVSLVKKDFQENKLIRPGYGYSDTFDSVKDYAQICYSKDGNLVVAAFPGSYCQEGRVLKFDILSHKLADAKFVDRETVACYISPLFEGGQVGDIFNMSAQGGDAGESITKYFQYDFVENIVREVKK